MNRIEANWWINTLCLKARIGGVFTHHGLSVMVTEEFDCAHCAFRNKGNGHYCLLMRGDGVIPCGLFNNNLGKPIGFVKIKLNLSALLKTSKKKQNK